MLNIQSLKKYDSRSMYEVYDKWPIIARDSYESNEETFDIRDISSIVFVGMGGSGTIGDFLSATLSQTKMPFHVVKGFHLPGFVDSNTLVVASSVSGNTLETLTILRKAKKKNTKLVTFTSGGTLLKYCKRNKIYYKQIKGIHSPRASFPKFLFIILKSLESILPVKKRDILDSIKKLETLQPKISTTNLTTSNTSLELAMWIKGIPVIYYPAGLQAAAIRFKNSLQENAKLHSMAEDVIEACHNGVVAWEQRTNCQPIMIEGVDDYFKTKLVWKILRCYFKENKIDYREIFSVEGNIVSKLICLIYLLDFASIYRAVLSQIDPTPINSINYIKRRL